MCFTGCYFESDSEEDVGECSLISSECLTKNKEDIEDSEIIDDTIEHKEK